ncbi:hypothetical protein IFM89_028795 [Coptis chinensis]|uniref:Uncharacterized protein n=1 Tax=Coptis chinensis TaxID=261450 RepID=A0A835H0F9_9MAGN|nr:hypothetical protein IFM89_028795 [Coptis chinensis]
MAIRDEGESCLVDLWCDFGMRLIQIRILEAARENAATLANSNDVIYLSKGMNVFLGLNPGQGRWILYEEFLELALDNCFTKKSILEG